MKKYLILSVILGLVFGTTNISFGFCSLDTSCVNINDYYQREECQRRVRQEYQRCQNEERRHQEMIEMQRQQESNRLLQQRQQQIMHNQMMQQMQQQNQNQMRYVPRNYGDNYKYRYY